jgi:DUF971 family protein
METAHERPHQDVYWLSPDHLRYRGGAEDQPDHAHFPRLLTPSAERRGKRNGQRGQQEAAAVHY